MCAVNVKETRWTSIVPYKNLCCLVALSSWPSVEVLTRSSAQQRRLQANAGANSVLVVCVCCGERYSVEGEVNRIH